MKPSKYSNSIKVVSALFLSLIFIFNQFSFAFAATQTISGDPIDLEVEDSGLIIPYFDNWVSRYQYYNYRAKNNVLWLNDGTLGFDAVSASTADCSGCTDFTPVSNSKPDSWTIVTIYDAGTTGIRITQTISYLDGAKYYNMNWSIANTGSTTYTDLMWMHGGDTYFGGMDSANGNYDAGLDMVYLTNSGVTGIMGLLGTPASPIDHYYEANYSLVRSALSSGSSLPDTVNASYVDAGYAVEWDRVSLAPGEVWEVSAIEKWTASGDVQVLSPAGQSGNVGDTFTYNFTIQNLQSSADIFDLTTNSSEGWTVALPGGTTVSIGAGASAVVQVLVTATAAGTDLTTLTATSQTSSEVTNDGSVTTIATQAAPLPATGFTPGQVTDLKLQPAERTYQGLYDMWLEIPSIDVKASLVGVPSVDGDWNVSWLGNNAGYLSGTAFPTWEGNTVITGHVWNADNHPGVFAGLKNLVYGDVIRIHAWGQVYTYQVQTSRLVSPYAPGAVLESKEQDWVTLFTCEDYKRFWEDYSYRRVVQAVLVEVRPAD